MPAAPDRIHATAVALGNAAVLIRGPSGSGKSDLALRCLAVPAIPLLGALPQLIADDQVLLTRSGSQLLASAPTSIRGKLEVRGLGIVDVEPADDVAVCLIADLVTDPVERLPEPRSLTLFGVDVPHLQIAPFEQSAPLKLLLALARSARD